jgi:hypothetical protein
MKKFLITLAMLASFSAFAADRTFTDKAGNSGVLTDEKCALEMYKEATSAKAAKLHIDGKDIQACYVEVNGAVMLADENGDEYGPFPVEMFQ